MNILTSANQSYARNTKRCLETDKITRVIVTKLLNWSNKLDQFGTYEGGQVFLTDGGGSSYPQARAI
ncbi:MAG: hypothetical protein WCD53_02585 [Microcoleus sp.]